MPPPCSLGGGGRGQCWWHGPEWGREELYDGGYARVEFWDSTAVLVIQYVTEGTSLFSSGMPLCKGPIAGHIREGTCLRDLRPVPPSPSHPKSLFAGRRTTERITLQSAPANNSMTYVDCDKGGMGVHVNSNPNPILNSATLWYTIPYQTSMLDPKGGGVAEASSQLSFEVDTMEGHVERGFGGHIRIVRWF